MAENTFRSFRSREPIARADVDPTARNPAGDPLAELARLIGQGDPNDEFGRNAGRNAPEPFDNNGSGGGLDWAADDGYAEQNHGYAAQNDGFAEPDRADDRFVPPPLAASYPSYSSNSVQSRPETGDADEPQPADQYSPPLASFGGPRGEARDAAAAQDVRFPDDAPPSMSRSRQTPAFAAQSPDTRYEAGEQRDQPDDQPYEFGRGLRGHPRSPPAQRFRRCYCRAGIGRARDRGRVRLQVDVWRFGAADAAADHQSKRWPDQDYPPQRQFPIEQREPGRCGGRWLN